MRVSSCLTIGAPAELVWETVADPSRYLHFMSGITRWDAEGEPRTGLGARRRMLIRVGSAEVGGLIEIVEWDEPRDLAWSSVTGIDQRGRVRLREAGIASTRIELRYAYGVAGSGLTGWLSERVSAPTISKHLRASLQALKEQIEHAQIRAHA